MPFTHRFFTTIQKPNLEGKFELEADYRDPYVQELILEKGWMIWPLIPYSYDTIDYELEAPAPSPPSKRHWLGTDDQARDVLGAGDVRVSHLGTVWFVVDPAEFCNWHRGRGRAGILRGLTDLFMQRFIEVWEGLPVLYLLIIMAAVIEPGFFSLLILMLLFSWTGLVAVVRAEFSARPQF